MQSRLPGYLAAIAVVLVWGMWLVVSRMGAQSPMSIYDLAAMRYGVSAIIALPIVLYSPLSPGKGQLLMPGYPGFM